MKLTVKGIEGFTRPGRYGDGGTLFLVVHPGGSKSFVQRLTINGKRPRHRFGAVPVDNSPRGQGKGISEPAGGMGRR